MPRNHPPYATEYRRRLVELAHRFKPTRAGQPQKWNRLIHGRSNCVGRREKLRSSSPPYSDSRPYMRIGQSCEPRVSWWSGGLLSPKEHKTLLSCWRPAICLRTTYGPRLATFLEKFPELELELLTRDQLGDIVAEGFDLAIRFGQPRPSRLIARKLLDTRVLTVAAPSYIERDGRPKSPRDLERGDHVLVEFRDPETGRPLARGVPSSLTASEDNHMCTTNGQ
jgi:hypothetical protein